MDNCYKNGGPDSEACNKRLKQNRNVMQLAEE